GVRTFQVRGTVPGKRRVPAERYDIALVGVEADAAVPLEERVLLRQRPAFLIGRGQRARLLFARFDIRLVERVDADDSAGDRGRDLEAEKLLTDGIVVGNIDANNRMSGGFDRADRLVLRCVAL